MPNGSEQDLAGAVDELKRELREAHRREAATAEVLKVISSSPTDVQAVFDTIVRSAVLLCGAMYGSAVRFDGELMHLVAGYNYTPEVDRALREAFPMQPSPRMMSGRAILSRDVVQVEDALDDPDYPKDIALAGGFRSMLAAPMVRDGRPIGAIVVNRGQPGPFSPTQIQLLRTFADQSAIALENARLFDEVQGKSQQLELANQFKSRFLAAASHDLRQPLHALNLFVAQLRAESDPAERSQLITLIEAAVNAMNELFEALLDMAKLDAGVLQPNFSEFPVERLFKRMQTTFAEAAREKGLRLSVAASAAWVRSDFILLERVLLNLVSNAVRYTSRGSVVVGCRHRGQMLRIDVWDSGAGIPEDQRQNIFGEFYQLGAPQSDRRGGLGLGLSIVDRLCHLLGHAIELTSRPAKGSRFSVLVPVARARCETTEAAPSSATIADPVRGKLIVVIDDDALVLNSMRGILQNWGCHVVTAPSSTAALAQLAEKDRQPDLIISDYHLMDGNTGLEVIEQLRAALGPIPAFLISGDSGPERMRQASASGYHLLHKPVPPITLRATLNGILKAREPTTQFSRTEEP